MDLPNELRNLIEGDISTDQEVKASHARDTSLFCVMPQVVVFPKNTSDIQKLIGFVTTNKKKHPELSLTARAAGTDMTGGPLGESIILSFTRYFRKHFVDPEHLSAYVEPGVFYHDFERETLPRHVYMPAYPASKGIAALGGMIMNNSGGEKTLKYGQMRDFVQELSVVLSDGNEYTFKKLKKDELSQKMKLQTFEGEIYRKTHDLLEANYDTIQKAAPRVSKNSAGYALWRIWNKENFDLTQLFTGSQGTLGILTGARLRLIHDKPKRRVIVLFFKTWDLLPEVVNAILPTKPESLEAFDDETLKLGIRFMPEIAKKAGSSFFSFLVKFIPELFIGIQMRGIPKLIVLVDLVEDTDLALDQKTKQIVSALNRFHVYHRILKTDTEAEKYWVMRRESFNLLRHHVHGKKAAPFIEDFCVDPEKIPEFLPKILEILSKNRIRANIAGHAGDGNFHIIPLMDLTDPNERNKIPKVMDLVYELIIASGGTITAEHNDGILRTPYLEQMYGKDVYALFKEIKRIFDPLDIFNPGKKVGGTIEYMRSHIATR